MSLPAAALRRILAGAVLFICMFGPVWPAVRWLASAMHIQWSGVPLISQQRGTLFLLLTCLIILCVGLAGRFAALILLARVLSRDDVMPLISLGGPDILQRLDESVVRRFYRK